MIELIEAIRIRNSQEIKNIIDNNTNINFNENLKNTYGEVQTSYCNSYLGFILEIFRTDSSSNKQESDKQASEIFSILINAGLNVNDNNVLNDDVLGTVSRFCFRKTLDILLPQVELDNINHEIKNVNHTPRGVPLYQAILKFEQNILEEKSDDYLYICQKLIQYGANITKLNKPIEDILFWCNIALIDTKEQSFSIVDENILSALESLAKEEYDLNSPVILELFSKIVNTPNDFPRTYNFITKNTNIDHIEYIKNGGTSLKLVVNEYKEFINLRSKEDLNNETLKEYLDTIKCVIKCRNNIDYQDMSVDEISFIIKAIINNYSSFKQDVLDSLLSNSFTALQKLNYKIKNYNEIFEIFNKVCKSGLTATFDILVKNINTKVIDTNLLSEILTLHRNCAVLYNDDVKSQKAEAYKYIFKKLIEFKNSYSINSLEELAILKNTLDNNTSEVSEVLSSFFNSIRQVKEENLKSLINCIKDKDKNNTIEQKNEYITKSINEYKINLNDNLYNIHNPELTRFCESYPGLILRLLAQDLPEVNHVEKDYNLSQIFETLINAGLDINNPNVLKDNVFGIVCSLHLQSTFEILLPKIENIDYKDNVKGTALNQVLSGFCHRHQEYDPTELSNDIIVRELIRNNASTEYTCLDRNNIDLLREHFSDCLTPNILPSDQTELIGTDI